ncbi:hypothetical protein ACWD4G_01970 [Streptomyces sp. NPDC002643]
MALAVVSVATLTGAAAPTSAFPASTAAAAAKAKKCGWHNAVGVPGKWTKSTYSCPTWGYVGAQVKYDWIAEKGTPCVKVKYNDKRQRVKWTKPLCGKSGAFRDVPWGNAAGYKEIQIKGFAMLKWK